MKRIFLKGCLRWIRFVIAAAGFLSTFFSSTVQIAAQCSPTITQVPSQVDSCGGFYFGNVQIPVGCSWSVSSSASWITVNGGGSGQGSFSMNFAVNSAGARQGSVTVRVGAQN